MKKRYHTIIANEEKPEDFADDIIKFQQLFNEEEGLTKLMKRLLLKTFLKIWRQTMGRIGTH